MKKISIYFQLSIVLLCFIILYAGCSDKNSPIKPDPCSGKQRVSAKFFMYEMPGTPSPEWENYDSDTIASGNVRFEVADQSLNCEWYIGSEKITEKSFIRSGFPRHSYTPITLIVHGTPNTECFPDDDGIDTLTRYLFQLKSTFDNDLFTGDFKGYNTDNPLEIFTINMDRKYCMPYPPYDTVLRIRNLVPGGDTWNWDGYAGFAWKECYVINNLDYNIGMTPRCLCRIHGVTNDSITIKYSIQRLPGDSNRFDRINKVFIGVRQ